MKGSKGKEETRCGKKGQTDILLYCCAAYFVFSRAVKFSCVVKNQLTLHCEIKGNKVGTQEDFSALVHPSVN